MIEQQCEWHVEVVAPVGREACRILFDRTRPHLVFCAADFSHRNSLLAQAKRSGIPVVVISRLPDPHDWLNAMDAGASDYAVAPLSRRDLNWILQSTIRRPVSA